MGTTNAAGIAELAKELPGNFSFDDLVIRSINFISRYVNACTGALYVYNEKHSLCQLKASFAFTESMKPFLIDGIAKTIRKVFDEVNGEW